MSLLFRADAGAAVGIGHVMRCLALAQAWQAGGGHAAFAVAGCPPALAERLTSEGVELFAVSSPRASISDAHETGELARRLGAIWIVADSYDFGADYQQGLKESGARVLLIDDYGHAAHYFADAVLNQNVDAADGLYGSREPGTQLLLGVRYVALRREFWRWRGWRREVPEIARRVLVTLGGSDPDNVTFKVVQALSQINVEGLEVTVVAGATNTHYEQLQQYAEADAGVFQLERNVADMPELMSRADVAICAGGTTSWELAFMGVPAVVLILADNQRGPAEHLGREGAAVNLGWHANTTLSDIASATREMLMSPRDRAEKSRRAHALVDGEGGFRVCAYVRSDAQVEEGG